MEEMIRYGIFKFGRFAKHQDMAISRATTDPSKMYPHLVSSLVTTEPPSDPPRCVVVSPSEPGTEWQRCSSKMMCTDYFLWSTNIGPERCHGFLCRVDASWWTDNKADEDGNLPGSGLCLSTPQSAQAWGQTSLVCIPAWPQAHLQRGDARPPSTLWMRVFIPKMQVITPPSQPCNPYTKGSVCFQGWDVGVNAW